VKTVVLFFEKGAPTRKIWYYQLDPVEILARLTRSTTTSLPTSLNCKRPSLTLQIVSIDAKTINKETFDLSAKNPNGGEDVKHRSPQKIMDEIAALDAESAKVLNNIRALL